MIIVASLVPAMQGCGMSSEVKNDPVFEPDYDVYQAAAAGDLESVKYFVQQYSWDPIIADYNGVLPLCYAAKSGNMDVITVLVEAGADINMPDLKGKKPLTYAKEAGKEEAAQFLQQNGATE